VRRDNHTRLDDFEHAVGAFTRTIVPGRQMFGSGVEKSRPLDGCYFGVDNMLNDYCRQYAIPKATSDGTTQNDVIWTAPPSGTVYMTALRAHFGAM
jgi:hypothetical protein